jgi:hypothetical protein
MSDPSSGSNAFWPRQVFLGAFIVGQLFFLVSTNLIALIRENRSNLDPWGRQTVEALAPGWTEEKGHLWCFTEQLMAVDTMWAQLTGQLQVWSLFAPTIGRECVFPAVELRWDDAAPPPELVLSDNEPADLLHYVRIGNFRLRRYENNFVLILRPRTDETMPETNERWRDAIQNHVADYAQIIEGYLRWHVARVMARQPSREMPKQATLILRRYHISDLEDAPPYWQGPFSMPIARWRPAALGGTGQSALEWYDPVGKQFKSLPQ